MCCPAAPVSGPVSYAALQQQQQQQAPRPVQAWYADNASAASAGLAQQAHHSRAAQATASLLSAPSTTHQVGLVRPWVQACQRLLHLKHADGAAGGGQQQPLSGGALQRGAAQRGASAGSAWAARNHAGACSAGTPCLACCHLGCPQPTCITSLLQGCCRGRSHPPTLSATHHQHCTPPRSPPPHLHHQALHIRRRPLLLLHMKLLAPGLQVGRVAPPPRLAGARPRGRQQPGAPGAAERRHAGQTPRLAACRSAWVMMPGRAAAVQRRRRPVQQQLLLLAGTGCGHGGDTRAAGEAAAEGCVQRAYRAGAGAALPVLRAVRGGAAGGAGAAHHLQLPAAVVAGAGAMSACQHAASCAETAGGHDQPACANGPADRQHV